MTLDDPEYLFTLNSGWLLPATQLAGEQIYLLTDIPAINRL